MDNLQLVAIGRDALKSISSIYMMAGSAARFNKLQRMRACAVRWGAAIETPIANFREGLECPPTHGARIRIPH